MRATSLLLLLSLALSQAAWADAEPARRLPLWEAGVVGVSGSQQAYPGAAEQTTRTLVLPYAVIRGQFLRSDRGSIGVRALRTPQFEFDLGLAGSLGSSSARIEARRGMPDLGTLIEAGPRLRWNLAGHDANDASGAWRLDLPLRAVLDLSNGLARRGLVFEPRLSYDSRAQDWRWSLSAAAVLGSRSLTEHFYGVEAQFVTSGRPAYEARAGLIAWRGSGSLSHAITPDLRAFATLRLDTVAGAANDHSPLVRQRHGASAAVGLVYTLKASRRPAFD